MIQPIHLDRIKEQSAAIIEQITNKEDRNNQNPAIIARILTEQTILGITLAIDVYRTYIPKGETPLFDEIKAIRVDLQEFMKSL